MATAAACGSSGSVSLGGEVTKWTLNLNQVLQEATSMSSSGNREYIGCLKDADFTFDTLVACGGVGASAGLVFTNDKDSYTFDFIIDSVSTSVDVAGIVTFTYSGKSTGEIT